MSYLKVTKWTKHQHYKNRRPPWVKFYVELANPKHKMNELPVATRYLFDRLLLLAANFDNAIPNDSELIAKLICMNPRDCREGLAQLLKGRWISETTTERRASKRASSLDSESFATETETEAEKKPSSTGLSTSRGVRPAIESTTEGEAQAERLLSYIRPAHKDVGTEKLVKSYVGKVPPSAFASLTEKLREGRGKIKNDGKYVNAELERIYASSRNGADS